MLPPSRQHPPRQAPIRYRTAGNVPGPDANLVPLPERRQDRRKSIRVVREVRVHLDHRLVALVEAPFEAVPVGAAQAELAGTRQHLDTAVSHAELGRDLGRAVGAVVVDDEDRRIRERLAHTLEDVLDCGSFIESRQHDQTARMSLWQTVTGRLHSQRSVDRDGVDRAVE